jgi:N-dimethylarginine dimethylaminohydrolase
MNSTEEACAGRRWVLMGDPAHFSVQGGANPHTRTRFGTRRQVDRSLAVSQWQRLRDTLQDLGVRVLVVPPDAAQPGLVYPANAGFMEAVDVPRPLSERRFHLANLLPTRAGEKPHYETLLAAAGIPTASIDERFRFEGEADFFPAGDVHLLTYGGVVEQRFVPALAFPPWKRIYGFRTDVGVEELLIPIIAPRRIVKIELTLEAHYHGDTVLCAFGPDRKFLLAYRRGLAAGAWQPLQVLFGERLIELTEEDATRYAANSFTLNRDGDSFLVMPEGCSDSLLAQVRERGVTPVTVDVSEFLKKGGGSVKCMIGDLGAIVPPWDVPGDSPREVLIAPDENAA